MSRPEKSRPEPRAGQSPNSQKETSNIWAAVLAAGKSQRFGAPKVLQSFLGIPFLTRIRENLQRAGIEEMLLILGYRAQRLMQELPDKGSFKIIINPHFELGMFSSVQAAVSALPESTPALLLCLIDQPHIRPETYRLLLQAAQSSDAAIISPVFRGKGGHPIVLPRALFPDILNASSEATLRQVVQQSALPLRRIDVHDPGILQDIDTRQQLKALEDQYRKQNDDK